MQRKNRKLETFIKPMLAALGDKPFNDSNWIFEIKWDGYRAITEIRKNGIVLYSRNGLSFSATYPGIIQELRKIKRNVVLDGEIVVLDENDRPSFQKLQHYEDNTDLPLIYYVFDCLSVDGRDIMSLPLVERKRIAQEVLPESLKVRYCDHVTAQGREFYTSVLAHNLEGMIAKRADSAYMPGRRSGDWLKIKNRNVEEAIIVGFTAPRGGRQYFGALVLAVYKQGKLQYAGHTGTGFTDKLLKTLYAKLRSHIRSESPLENKKVKVNGPVTWVDPVFVCAIKFTEKTEEGMMRHPVFIGLRIDKDPREVTLDN